METPGTLNIFFGKSSNLTCVNEIRWISDHCAIDSQALMMPTSSRASLLLEAAGKPLKPNISSGRHFFVGTTFY
jgi:hypothetical protein